ncbi:putative mating-type switching protein swi10 [Xylogone sp. PMI_703]|nr:putative mating-type switching protein swi10 [Xylogone sp. PMI_703]
MDDDDDFGADADFLVALAASEASASAKPQRVVQPTPQRIQQPIPQRLDHPPPTPSSSSSSSATKVVQPTPQALPNRSSGSSILVSPRQKGNPILTHLRSFAWEYSDIPADYVLGLTTCALFLSLKYHRLHPEYIYNRIKGLAGKFNLRVLLTMVDIGNHEDSLKELSKTGMVNNMTVILCWSAAEAARYLELYKSFEHANASAIKGVESKGYTEKMVDFVTVPRSINKTDAVAIVSAFGSLRAAINARPEELVVLDGWGEKKVKRWCSVVDEPFRARKATKRDHSSGSGGGTKTGGVSVLDRTTPLGRGSQQAIESSKSGQAKEQEKASSSALSQTRAENGPDDDETEAMIAAAIEENDKIEKERQQNSGHEDEELSSGIAAALAKLRKQP